jgi:hypothetical protein
MNASSRAARTALTVAGLVSALSLLGGCSPKISAVDSSYTQPEGVANGAARLLVYPDAPLSVQVWTDHPYRDPLTGIEISNTWNPASATDPTGDVLVSEETFYQSGPGAILGVVLDRSVASGFQPLRRESNGALRAFLDQPLVPLRRWIDSGGELYQFVDTSPSGYSPASYFATGLIDGSVRTGSPVTNEGVLSSSSVGDITYTGAAIPPDSLFLCSWNPVAGAASYWIQVFEYLPSANTDDRRRGAATAPLSVSKTRDFFLAQLPAATTSYRIAGPGATVYTYVASGFRRGRSYLVRVSAVDAAGRLIAYTKGADVANAIVSQGPGTGQITVSQLGAIKVTP